MFILQDIVACVLVTWIVEGHCFESAKGNVCYFNQEPDQSGKLRWTTSFEHDDRCSCVSLRPGGMTRVRQQHAHAPIYTDTPLFTDDQDDIKKYFDCQVPVSITCPTSITKTVTKGDVTGTAITWAPPKAAGSSGVSPKVTLLSDKANGTFFPFGQYTVSYKAVGSHNNIDECQFTVTVDPHVQDVTVVYESDDIQGYITFRHACVHVAVDGVKPHFTSCPLNINKNITTTTTVVVEWDEPTATDNTGIQPTVVNETPQHHFTKGTHIVTYRATDEAGNMQICTFNVVIAEKPVYLIGKPTEQSSWYGSKFGSDKAIDGDIKTFNHNSKNDPHPWWKVDLVEIYCLGTVTVTLRTGCCGHRSTAATVRAGNWSTFSQNQQCGLPITPAQSMARAVIEFVCDPPVFARFVSVDINVADDSVTEARLQFAEVTVEEATTTCL